MFQEEMLNYIPHALLFAGLLIILMLNIKSVLQLKALRNANIILEAKINESLESRHQEHYSIIAAINKVIIDQISALNFLQKSSSDSLHHQLIEMIKITESKLTAIRETVERQLFRMQQDNNHKLEKMREVVDEKLHQTLETRLSQSFQIVSDRLELVHKGLGEMQHIAAGVGDLKKVLQNVKTRGVWGEAQLEALITQLMTVDQYEKNAAIPPNSQNRVEFAIKIPDMQSEDAYIFLPIDAKFPIEDYHRLIDAYENGKPEDVAQCLILLETNVKK
jgi:DNA recombination protein RmuC